MPETDGKSRKEAREAQGAQVKRQKANIKSQNAPRRNLLRRQASCGMLVAGFRPRHFPFPLRLLVVPFRFLGSHRTLRSSRRSSRKRSPESVFKNFFNGAGESVAQSVGERIRHRFATSSRTSSRKSSVHCSTQTSVQSPVSTSTSTLAYSSVEVLFDCCSGGRGG